MEEGLLSLKWNNHKSTFFQVLSVLREKHTYTDVTLACEGRLYQAHKFVLSTCSEYFSDIFTSTSGNSIVIVLKDVRRQDLEYLMDYMYLGQVDVAQSELPSLIKTAECLRIKGLAIPDDEPHKTSRGRSADEREGSPPPSKKKRYLQEDDRPSAAAASSSSINNTTTTATSSSSSTSSSTSARLQMEGLPPPPDLGSLVQQLRHVPLPHPPLHAPLPPPPSSSQSSSSSSKSHSSQLLSLNLTTSRIVPSGNSGPHPSTPTTTPQSSHPPLPSPSHTTPIPVIKEEVADPPETPEGYLNESFDENETKPDVSDPRHLDPDGAVPGPSGLQGPADNWDGDGEMSGYGGGDGYPEGSLEEQGESEIQGRCKGATQTEVRKQRPGGDEAGVAPATGTQQTTPSNQHSPENSDEVIHLPHEDVTLHHPGKWCSGVAFSVVGRDNIMNLIPMYEVNRRKVIKQAGRRKSGSKDEDVSLQIPNTSQGTQEKPERSIDLPSTCTSEGNLQDFGHKSRPDPQNLPHRTFGRLTYTPQSIVVNLTSYSSIPSSSQTPVINSTFPLSSSSSFTSSLPSLLTDSSSSNASDTEKSLASNEGDPEMQAVPKVVQVNKKHPPPSPQVPTTLTSPTSPEPFKILTLSPSQLQSPVSPSLPLPSSPPSPLSTPPPSTPPPPSSKTITITSSPSTKLPLLSPFFVDMPALHQSQLSISSSPPLTTPSPPLLAPQQPLLQLVEKAPLSSPPKPPPPPPQVKSPLPQSLQSPRQPNTLPSPQQQQQVPPPQLQPPQVSQLPPPQASQLPPPQLQLQASQLPPPQLQLQASQLQPPQPSQITMELVAVDSIASHTTITTRTPNSNATHKVKQCNVLLPRVLACPRCCVVLPSSKRFKQHVTSCQQLTIMDIKPIPDHNYSFHF